MKVILTVPYKTNWGQTICIFGSASEVGSWDENKAVDMQFVAPDLWYIELDINDAGLLEYHYLLKENGQIVHREWGKSTHFLHLDAKNVYSVHDSWINPPTQDFLYTSGFTGSFFRHELKKPIENRFQNAVLFQVTTPHVDKNQALIICGESPIFGQWNPKAGVELIPVRENGWQALVDVANIKEDTQAYKLLIYDKAKDGVVHWEEGDNRILQISVEKKPAPKTKNVQVESLGYRYSWMNWRTAGVAVPVFSLRSDDSFGIGDFSDLKKIADWAYVSGQKIIQVLPVNDTTITHTWRDSYPYNAISIYALHPIYLGLTEFPLKNNAANKKYRQSAKILNALSEVDYENVLELKLAYITDLFGEIGKETLAKNEFSDFYAKNESWLFPYACFCYFRDKYRTADFHYWEAFSNYDERLLKNRAKSDEKMQNALEKVSFTQYLLHIQLSEAKRYANKKGVVFKGDVPIGISRYSVEAWTEPELFNLDTQTGAPPDDFSVTGQNWGFPTYNWDAMSKNGYVWWKKRFQKMADYFDIYRVDHILGFFRIWEIPESSVQGLLGYFNPAIPLSVEEINSRLRFNEERMTKPLIQEQFLPELFGEYTSEVTDNFLQQVNAQYFQLKDNCNTQKKIKGIFKGQEDEKSSCIRAGLYRICEEVLFIRDKKELNKFHPRITAQYTFVYKELDDAAKNSFNKLYDYFFYSRHSKFWKGEALRKLTPLITATNMLACGEDLGMVPASVPEVMNELQLFSLEIERMPKTEQTLFNNLMQLPCKSVCTTSTHDMSPIRLWWRENRDITQRYYNEILERLDTAPDNCSSDLCEQIVIRHLHTSSILAILPLQDWLSMDNELKRPNPEEERINVPSNPQNRWNYRMHLSLERLTTSTAFNEKVRKMIEESGRN